MNIGNLLTWNFLKGMGSFFLKFVYGILTARTLGPAIMGQMAIILAFSGFAKIFINSGFKSRIIQAEKITEKELNSIFAFNLSMSIMLSLIFFLSAHYIADFFNMPEVAPYIQIYSVTLILQALYIVPVALNDRHYRFKKNTQAILLSNLISLVISAIFLVLGYGLGSLVLYSILNNLILLIVINYKSQWKPKMQFSRSSLMRHVPYSANLLLIRLFEEFTSKFDNIITGKYFDASTLGFFSKSKDLSRLPNAIMTTTINNTLFSIFARNQSSEEYAASLFKVFLFGISLIYFNVFFFIIFFSNELVLMILTDKWIGMDSMFKLSLIAMMIKGVTSFKGYFILSKGDSKLIANSIYYAGSVRILLVVLVVIMANEVNPTYFLIGLIISEIVLFVRYGITVCKILSVSPLQSMIKYSREFIGPNGAFLTIFLFSAYCDLNLVAKIVVYILTTTIVLVLEYAFSKNFRKFLLDIKDHFGVRKV